jgi:hypothetical protein
VNLRECLRASETNQSFALRAEDLTECKRGQLQQPWPKDQRGAGLIGAMLSSFSRPRDVLSCLEATPSAV